MKIKFEIILLLLFFSISGYSQNVDSLLIEQKEFADSIFNSGDFYQAITEYKRLEFFDADDKYKFYCELKIGLAYKFGGFYENAENYIKSAISLAEGVKKQEAQIELVKLYIVSHKSDKALNFIDEIENEFNGKSEIYYWRGWAYLFGLKPNLSAYYFSKSGKAKQIADKVKKISKKFYSVSTAKLLSYIIPGTGQIYIGEYFPGIISFSWNALWLYVMGNAFVDGRIIEGFVVGDLLWLRFFKGNIENVEKLTNKKNVKLLNQLLENLQNNYKGELP